MSRRTRTPARASAAPLLALALALGAACSDATVVDRLLGADLGPLDGCRFEDVHVPIVPVHAARLLVADPTLPMQEWPGRMLADYVDVWLAADGERRLRVRGLGDGAWTRPLPDYVPVEELAFGPFAGGTTSRLLRHGDDLLHLSWRRQGLVELSSREPGVARTLAAVPPDEGRRAEFDAGIVGDEVVIVLSRAPAGILRLEGRVGDGRIRLDPARESSLEGLGARAVGAAGAFHLFFGTGDEARRELRVSRRAAGETEWSPSRRLSEAWSSLRDLSFTSHERTLYVAWSDDRHQERRGLGIVNHAKPYVAVSTDGGISWSEGRCVADARDREDTVDAVDGYRSQIALSMWSGRPVLFWGSLEGLCEAPQAWRIRARVLSADLRSRFDLPYLSGEDVMRAFRARIESAFRR